MFWLCYNETYYRGSGQFTETLCGLVRGRHIQTREQLVKTVCRIIDRWKELGSETTGGFFHDIWATFGYPVLPSLEAIATYIPPPSYGGGQTFSGMGMRPVGNLAWEIPRIYYPRVHYLMELIKGKRTEKQEGGAAYQKGEEGKMLPLQSLPSKKMEHSMKRHAPGESEFVEYECSVLRALEDVHCKDTPYPGHLYYRQATWELLFEILPNFIEERKVQSPAELLSTTELLITLWKIYRRHNNGREQTPKSFRAAIEARERLLPIF